MRRRDFLAGMFLLAGPDVRTRKLEFEDFAALELKPSQAERLLSDLRAGHYGLVAVEDIKKDEYGWCKVVKLT